MLHAHVLATGCAHACSCTTATPSSIQPFLSPAYEVLVLAENRELAKEALSVLGPDAVVGDAAIYLLAKLPDGMDDVDLVRRLIQEHRVTCIPGSACGCPGYIRVAFANCTTEQCRDACERLRTGLVELLPG